MHHHHRDEAEVEDYSEAPVFLFLFHLEEGKPDSYIALVVHVGIWMEALVLEKDYDQVEQENGVVGDSVMENHAGGVQHCYEEM